MNPFVVSDSNDCLLYARSRDHLDSVMTDWDVALIFADEPLMKSLLERAKRYPEVYVLICVDLLTKPEFAQTVGQQYKTRQQRADLFCPFKDSEVLIRPEDSDLNSSRIIRFTDALNESVMRRAVSIINEAPSNTPVHGPLKEKVARAHIRETAPPADPRSCSRPRPRPDQPMIRRWSRSLPPRLRALRVQPSRRWRPPAPRRTRLSPHPRVWLRQRSQSK